jgi:hypothetical protein
MNGVFQDSRLPSIDFGEWENKISQANSCRSSKNLTSFNQPSNWRRKEVVDGNEQPTRKAFRKELIPKSAQGANLGIIRASKRSSGDEAIAAGSLIVRFWRGKFRNPEDPSVR